MTSIAANGKSPSIQPVTVLSPAPATLPSTSTSAPASTSYTIRHPYPQPSNKYSRLIASQNIALVDHFELENGDTLQDVQVAYKTWGKLNERKDNCMVICHALTGSADVEDW
jgi:hypothetical protein